MFVTRLDVPQDTRLSFQPDHGPLHLLDDFYDLGLVILAEQHADDSADPSDLQDNRMVLECEGVEASHLFKQLNWPIGESVLPGIVRFGTHSYTVSLQVRARPHGLRAILRVDE